jgi:hypothetical protein
MVSQSRPYLYAHRTAQKRQPRERLAIPVLRVVPINHIEFRNRCRAREGPRQRAP